MAQLNIRIDDPVKEKVTVEEDPLYNPAMIARIKESIRQFEQGMYIEKSIEELERMADE